MPKKKSASGAVSPPQPAKKMKTRSSAAAVENQSNEAPHKRAKAESNTQNENSLCDPASQAATRTTRSSADKKLEEVNLVSTAQASRGALPMRRGSGFVVESPNKLTKSKSSDKTGMECAVLLRQVDLSERVELKKGINDAQSSRKRRGKNSPESNEKKIKPSTAVSGQSGDSRATKQSNDESSTEHMPQPLPSKSTSNEKNTQASAPKSSKQSCLSTVESSILPTKADDPLFNRSHIKACSRWSQSPDSKKCFSVMTYNILAECNRVKSDYSYTSNQHLDLQSYRHSRIYAEIKCFDSDIVCLQEVDLDYYNTTLLSAMRKLGYSGLYYKRYGEDFPEGAATFFRNSHFSLVESFNCRLSDLAEKDINRLECSEEVKESIRQYLCRKEVVMISKLIHKFTKRELLVGNTHIAWTKFIDIDINCAQTAYALKEMVKLSSECDCPFLLVGDFNSRREDPAYQLASDGYLNDNSIKRLQSVKNVDVGDGSKRALVDLMWAAFQHPGVGVHSTYLTVQGKEPAVTSFTSFMSDGVDYMWYSENIHPINCLAVNEVTMPLPTAIYPSDHISLQATYTF